MQFTHALACIGKTERVPIRYTARPPRFKFSH